MITQDRERNLQLTARLRDITQNRKRILHQYIGDLAHILKGPLPCFPEFQCIENKHIEANEMYENCFCNNCNLVNFKLPDSS